MKRENIQDQIRNFHPDTDTDTIADALGVDEDEVIAVISGAGLPKSDWKPVRDKLNDMLRNYEREVLGYAVPEKSRKHWKEGTKFSDYSEGYDFTSIDNARPSILFLIVDNSIIIRKWIEGDFTDFRYEKSDGLLNLLNQGS